ncbi:carbohydrate-binding domain-containing protein [Glutamicibacter nicotianae]|uniref:carbohydrate-binding domain-containing protein n=1 Tax=Glutamicibacter nicotianae TaxID=37929 RepID=UPI003CD0C322
MLTATAGAGRTPLPASSRTQCGRQCGRHRGRERGRDSANGYPYCSSSASDPDGDGWGWRTRPPAWCVELRQLAVSAETD